MGGSRAGGIPTGVRWRLSAGWTTRNRTNRFRRFLEVAQPTASATVLDVGVTNSTWRSGNFFESNYPWPTNITAVAIEDMPAFRGAFPEVRLVIADGRSLPFADDEFDIGFSNAVVEHVGSREQQRQFIAELVRTCRFVYVSTPNAWFPIDPHTLLPFVHWLPRPLRHPILRASGNGRWASQAALNPLSTRAFVGLFAPHGRLRVIRQRFLFLTTVTTVVSDRRGQPA
jgi:methyltransferase family protein